MHNRTLRSSNVLLLKVPRFKNKTLGARTFAYAAATLWNSLPLEIRAIDNIDSFKSSLKKCIENCIIVMHFNHV